jgi:hypothetical protein
MVPWGKFIVITKWLNARRTFLALLSIEHHSRAQAQWNGIESPRERLSPAQRSALKGERWRNSVLLAEWLEKGAFEYGN